MSATRRSKNMWHQWRRAHRGKWRYTTRRAARWGTVRMWLRHGTRVHAYPCWWTNDWTAGPVAGPLHFHLGHRRRPTHGPGWRTPLRVCVIWPYYRARSWGRRRGLIPRAVR
jgi:hypothetical protein